MRLNQFLKEQDGAGGTPSPIGNNSSGEGYREIGSGATTSKNIAPFINKVFNTPARRRIKKKKKDIPEIVLKDNIIQDLCDCASHHRLNEAILPDFIFKNIKDVGSKIGLNVKRSDTFFDYIADAEREIQELFNLICLYILATPQNKVELKAEIKTNLKKINHQRLMAFLLMMDKMTFGLTSLIRHVLMGVFGLEISTYNKWSSDITYILSHLDKVKDVLMKLSPTSDEVTAFNHLYDVILKTKAEIEKSK